MPAKASPLPAVQAEVVRWLSANGHRLASSEPTATDLAPIVQKLAGARVIGLGEVTHGTHEDVAFKSLLVRELVKAGAMDTLVIKANRVVGAGFDRYVRRIFAISGDPGNGARKGLKIGLDVTEITATYRCELAWDAT